MRGSLRRRLGGRLYLACAFTRMRMQVIQLPGSSVARPRPALRRGRPGNSRWLIGLTMVLASVFLFALPSVLPVQGVINGIGGVGFQTAGQTVSCPGTLAYLSAFRNWDTNAKGTLLSGSTVTIEYQFEALNWIPSDGNVTLYTPSIFAKLPISAGGNMTAYFPPSHLPLPSSGWSNTSYSTDVHKVTSTITFTTARASLTTELLGVQMNASYGLNLSLHWRWILTPSSGPVVTGGWSTPQNGILPVPKVTVTPTEPTGSTQYLGTQWTATIDGLTSGVTFVLEVENGTTSFPRGMLTVVAPVGNNTPFQVSFPLFYTRPNVTFPGLVLVHVHEQCRGLLSNTVVNGVYAPSTQIRLTTNQTACSTVIYNGTTYSNNTWVTVTPSVAFHSLQAGTCAGHTFMGWTQAGEEVVSNLTDANTTVQVTYKGFLTADWS
jgi:hypothetical protein